LGFQGRSLLKSEKQFDFRLICISFLIGLNISQMPPEHKESTRKLSMTETKEKLPLSSL
jgi:hypothetical protein